MPTISKLRRVAAPALLGGLLATTTLVSASPAQAALPTAVMPVRIVPGVVLEAKPWTLPVRGYRLTGRFGQSSGLWARTHTGLDFAAPEGAEIRSIAPGVVVSAGYDGSYGNKTAVRLEDGTVLWYAHQSSIGVSVGQRVDQGQVLGHVGSTGNVTGPHLHLEVRPGDGDPIDPQSWLVEHGVTP